jgi:DNA-binding transcriptional LysR family regulator
MWQTVELREIRVFLALAEELHFGYTAERLGLTQSRVSQSIRTLEQKLGQRLVDRSSRRVALTSAGRRFHRRIEPAYGELTQALSAAQRSSRRRPRPLKLGLLAAASASPLLLEALSRYEASHPHSEIQLVELPFRDRFAPLRRGNIDMIVSRIPIDEAGLIVGPVLSQDQRVLAVGRDHPLALYERVSLDQIAEFEVTAIDDILPPALAHAFIPPTTPSGRPIKRFTEVPRDPQQLIMLIAQAKIVHPTVPGFLSSFGHANIVSVPITDLPPSESALVWQRYNHDPTLQEFVKLTTQFVESARARG